MGVMVGFNHDAFGGKRWFIVPAASAMMATVALFYKLKAARQGE